MTPAVSPEAYSKAFEAWQASLPPAQQGEAEAQRARDWPGICRYKAANAAIGAGERPRAVLMGDSITDNWTRGDPALFTNGVVGRGIGGQTSPQMLARFRQDVVALHPRVVHIMAGTNDIAGNTGPATVQDYQSNILAMIELARANDIAVVLAGIPPSRKLSWRGDLDPRPLIRELNGWLRGVAFDNGYVFVDYAAVLADAEGGLRADLGNDGVHPNRVGYARMRPLTETVIAEGARARDRDPRRTPEHGTPRRALRQHRDVGDRRPRSAALGQRPLATPDAAADVARVDRRADLGVVAVRAARRHVRAGDVAGRLARAVRRERRDTRAAHLRAATPERPSRARNTGRRLHVRVRAERRRRLRSQAQSSAATRCSCSSIGCPGEGWQQGDDVPLQDAQRAMRLIRANAARWRIDPQTLSVVGFSAGGHLAATLATDFAQGVYAPVDAADSGSARPFATALIYPVVTMALPGTHAVSRELLLGPNPSPTQIARRSAQLHVGADTPPLFLVHALDDAAVPVTNSLDLLAVDARRESPRGSASAAGRRARVRVGLRRLPDGELDRHVRRVALAPARQSSIRAL